MYSKAYTVVVLAAILALLSAVNARPVEAEAYGVVCPAGTHICPSYLIGYYTCCAN